jgi:hypothetical protein
MKKLIINAICILAMAAFLVGCSASGGGGNTDKLAPFEAESFEELNAAIIAADSKSAYFNGMTGYFVPFNPPMDMEIRIVVFPEIEVIYYYNPDGSGNNESEAALMFEWHRAYEGEAAQEFVTEAYDWAMTESEDEVLQDGNYFRRIKPEGTTDVVFWYEDGRAFNANVPKSWSWEQVREFCTAQWVPVTPQG